MQRSSLYETLVCLNKSSSKKKRLPEYSLSVQILFFNSGKTFYPKLLQIPDRIIYHQWNELIQKVQACIYACMGIATT